MHITLLTEHFPPAVGGIENYLHHLADELAQRHDVVVVAGPVPNESPKFADRERGAYQLQRRRLRLPLLKPAWLFTYLLLHRQAKAGKIDILLAGKGLFEGLLGYYLKKHCGVPYYIFTYAMEIKTWAADSRTRRKLMRALSAAEKVIYINDVTEHHLQELGVREEQLLKVPPGIDRRFFNSVSQPLIESTLRHYQIIQPYVLAVGRLIPRKGFDTLIEAFSRLDQTKFADLELVIVGSGPELGNLTELAEENFMATSVKFLQNVQDKHLPALYAGADVFALTPHETETDMEGFGIVYLEAASQGTPAVATKTGGAQEAVLGGKTGLVVTPNDADAVASALEQLLTNTSLRATLGDAGRERAEEFSWKQCLAKLGL